LLAIFVPTLSASHCCGLKDGFYWYFYDGSEIGEMVITLIFTRVSLLLGLAAFWRFGEDQDKRQRYLK